MKKNGEIKKREGNSAITTLGYPHSFIQRQEPVQKNKLVIQTGPEFDNFIDQTKKKLKETIKRAADIQRQISDFGSTIGDETGDEKDSLVIQKEELNILFAQCQKSIISYEEILSRHSIKV